MKQFLEVRVLKSKPFIGLKAQDATNSRKFPSVGKVVEYSCVDTILSPGAYIVSVNGHNMQGKTAHDVHEVVRQTSLGKEVVFVMKPKGRVLMQSHGSMLSLGSRASDSESSAAEDNSTPSPHGSFSSAFSTDVSTAAESAKNSQKQPRSDASTEDLTAEITAQLHALKTTSDYDADVEEQDGRPPLPERQYDQNQEFNDAEFDDLNVDLFAQ
eukprot:m.128777 g.128777  ORF g.128777 m.128777 type:complete len:213 (+) comp17446_c0_seq1:229-867(+)